MLGDGGWQDRLELCAGAAGSLQRDAFNLIQPGQYPYRLQEKESDKRKLRLHPVHFSSQTPILAEEGLR